jgi:hypothetical protein
MKEVSYRTRSVQAGARDAISGAIKVALTQKSWIETNRLVDDFCGLSSEVASRLIIALHISTRASLIE